LLRASIYPELHRETEAVESRCCVSVLAVVGDDISVRLERIAQSDPDISSGCRGRCVGIDLNAYVVRIGKLIDVVLWRAIDDLPHGIGGPVSGLPFLRRRRERPEPHRIRA